MTSEANQRTEGAGDVELPGDTGLRRRTCVTGFYDIVESQVSRSFECTIQVFGWVGCPMTALSCPREIAFTTARWDTQAVRAASLTDR